MTLKTGPTRRHRHTVRLDASATRGSSFEVTAIVTDFSLEGCCLLGYFRPGEIVDLAIRGIGRFRAQIQWVKLGRAGARFLDRRVALTSQHAAAGRLLADVRGVAAIEYACLAALIAVSLMAAFTTLGSSVAESFAYIGTAVVDSLGGTSYETDPPQT